MPLRELIRLCPQQLVLPPLPKPTLDDLLEIQSPFTYHTCQFDNHFEKVVNNWLRYWMMGSNRGVRLMCFKIAGYAVSRHVLFRNIAYEIIPPTVSRSIFTPANVEAVVVGGYGIKSMDQVEATISIDSEILTLVVWDN